MSDQSNEQVHEELPPSRTFNPREHLIQLKSREGSKDYLPVQWRLVWFREQCPQGTIETEIVHMDLDKETEEETFAWNSEKRRSEKVVKSARGIAVVRAVVRDGKGGVATGTKMEKAASFPDWLEKAETGAIGRALAALGYGTQFAPDLDEAHRIVDAPVERALHSTNGNGAHPVNGSMVPMRASSASSNASANDNGAPRDENAEASVTEQQVASIRKLCQHLGKSEPDNVTSISFLAAKRLIQQLTAEYKEFRQNSKAS
jgi:hypothetical protein